MTLVYPSRLDIIRNSLHVKGGRRIREGGMMTEMKDRKRFEDILITWKMEEEKDRKREV